MGAFTALNGIASGIATSFGAKIADGYTAFQIATIPYGGDYVQGRLVSKALQTAPVTRIRPWKDSCCSLAQYW